MDEVNTSGFARASREMASEQVDGGLRLFALSIVCHILVDWKSMIPTLTWTPEGFASSIRPSFLLKRTTCSPPPMNRCRRDCDHGRTRAHRPSVFRPPTALRSALSRQKAETAGELGTEFERICARLAGTRPTAVNLFWAIDRMKKLFTGFGFDTPISIVREKLLADANAMYNEDIAACKAMAHLAARCWPDEGGVLTHCNAGALATCGYGTALGVIRSAVEQGKRIHVYADETRPFLQGARLTAWELIGRWHPNHCYLRQHGGQSHARRRIKAVVVARDRIAANGDFANKIGTYNVAILAKEHGIPFIARRRGRPSILPPRQATRSH